MRLRTDKDRIKYAREMNEHWEERDPPLVRRRTPIVGEELLLAQDLFRVADDCHSDALDAARREAGAKAFGTALLLASVAVWTFASLVPVNMEYLTLAIAGVGLAAVTLGLAYRRDTFSAFKRFAIPFHDVRQILFGHDVLGEDVGD